MRIAEIEPERQAGERTRISALGALVETGGCRRAVLLRHFGEDPPEQCGNCDNCLSPPASIDATQTARKLLSAVYRTGQSFGIGHLEAVLRGQTNDKVQQRGHDRLSVFGIINDDEALLIKPVARALLIRDALGTNEHGGLMLGPQARAILRDEVQLPLVLPPKRTPKGKRGGDTSNPVSNPLFEALRACRRDLAHQAGVPPYVIFHDSTLREMTERSPETMEALSRISGVGTRKLEAYGEAFLQVIRDHIG